MRGWLLECCNTLLAGSGAATNFEPLSSALKVELTAMSGIPWSILDGFVSPCDRSLCGSVTFRHAPAFIRILTGYKETSLRVPSFVRTYLRTKVRTLLATVPKVLRRLWNE